MPPARLPRRYAVTLGVAGRCPRRPNPAGARSALGLRLRPAAPPARLTPPGVGGCAGGWRLDAATPCPEGLGSPPSPCPVTARCRLRVSLPREGVGFFPSCRFPAIKPRVTRQQGRAPLAFWRTLAAGFSSRSVQHGDELRKNGQLFRPALQTDRNGCKSALNLGIRSLMKELI